MRGKSDHGNRRHGAHYWKRPAMSAETITKRLHISGLTTPSITPTDLAKRLGAFGKVISLDGFGKHDALGQPRPFGYVTIEGRKADLTRCEY